jgi:hypothetical protein
LTGGAYQARGNIANYLVCENLFPEINPPEDSPPVPVTHYPREGLAPLAAPPTPGAGRGVFATSNGALYAVVGDTVYSISPLNWSFTAIGTVYNIETPVSLADNGTSAVIVDGTTNGYVITLANNAFAALVDGTGTFVGATRVDFSDTYLAFNAPGTNEWYLTLSNQVVFNALVQANKDSKPDEIVTLAFNLRQAWLIGATSSEIWYLAGSTPFPYQEWPNIFVPYGCAAPYSLVQADVCLFWISRNEQGQALAVQTKGYGVIAISTRALEYEWSTYSTVADAIGRTFQQAGHTFIIFDFPTANASWGYDLSTKQWHRRVSLDANGNRQRDKVGFLASVGAQGGFPPTIVGQDWATGQIYALDPQTYTDNGSPIVCKRTFPHVMKDMHEITSTSFVADFETGDSPGGALERPWSSGFVSAFGPSATIAVPFRLSMRYSNDGGKKFGNYRTKGFADAGEYRSMMRFRGLGMARDRVYELSWAYPGKSALQGAYLDPIEHSA